MRELYKNHPNAKWHSAIEKNPAPDRIFHAFVLNASFTVIEFIGGILSGSVAIIADAVHDLGDSICLGVAWYLERFARKEKDDIFSYGYGRFSLLSALISAVAIIAGMAYVLVEATHRFIDPNEPNGLMMMGLSIFGILVNGFAAHKLSHGHTQNEKVLTWHLLEDVFGWVAVLIGSLMIIFFETYWVDPLLAVMVALYIGYSAIKNLLGTMKLMLQSVPDGFDPEKYLQDVLQITGVKNAHDLHVWSMDGERHILSLHIVCNEDISDFERVKRDIRKLTEHIGHFHATIEIETPHEKQQFVPKT